jgi:hypothetical protein
MAAGTIFVSRISHSSSRVSQAASAPEDDRITVAAPLVLGYLILNNLFALLSAYARVDSHYLHSPPARFAISRLQVNARHQPLVQALLELLASTQSRKHEGVYSRSAQLVSLVEAPGFFSADLAAAVKHLVAQFLSVSLVQHSNKLTHIGSIMIESFRSLALYLLAESYRSLPITHATRVMGLNEPEVINGASMSINQFRKELMMRSALRDVGWTVNIKDKTLTPPVASAIASESKNMLLAVPVADLSLSGPSIVV